MDAVTSLKSGKPIFEHIERGEPAPVVKCPACGEPMCKQVQGPQWPLLRQLLDLPEVSGL